MPAPAHVLALLLVSTSPDGLPSPSLTAHDIEIKAFSMTVAVVLTASSKCADILIDHDLLAALKQSAHIVDEDKPALTREVQANVSDFKTEIAATPELQTWCDEAFRLYGSPGLLIPGLLAR